MIVINCLKGIAANFYDKLTSLTNWNTVKQLANTQLRVALIIRFESEVQMTYYYNRYLALKQKPI